MQIKLKRIIGILLFFCICDIMRCFASERVTFTTYYPSPYGMYYEARSKRIALGDTYYQTADSCWEGVCTNSVASSADLLVEGNVGIGTRTPKVPLDVNGTLRIGTSTTCDPSTGSALRFSTNKLEYCDGTSSFKEVIGSVTPVAYGGLGFNSHAHVGSNWSFVTIYGYKMVGGVAAGVSGYIVRTSATAYNDRIYNAAGIHSSSGPCNGSTTAAGIRIDLDSACSLTINNLDAGSGGADLLGYVAFY